jgi:hypothetical protein
VIKNKEGKLKKLNEEEIKKFGWEDEC